MQPAREGWVCMTHKSDIKRLFWTWMISKYIFIYQILLNVPVSPTISFVLTTSTLRPYQKAHLHATCYHTLSMAAVCYRTPHLVSPAGRNREHVVMFPQSYRFLWSLNPYVLTEFGSELLGTERKKMRWHQLPVSDLKFILEQVKKAQRVREA